MFCNSSHRSNHCRSADLFNYSPRSVATDIRCVCCNGWVGAGSVEMLLADERSDPVLVFLVGHRAVIVDDGVFTAADPMESQEVRFGRSSGRGDSGNFGRQSSQAQIK